MGTWVGLLRGVNVGGRNKVPMAALRDAVADLGYEDVRTYVQSGNVVFRSASRSEAAVANAVEGAITAVLDLQVRVLVRSAVAIDEVVAANPFPELARDPTKLVVVFLEQAITDSQLPDVPGGAIEEVRAGDRHLYVSYPDGQGRSQLDDRYWRQLPKQATTARNWRTVLALRDLTRS